MDSLPALFHRALTAAAKASNLPTIQDATQEIVTSALKDLRNVNKRVTDLSLFSPNETLEDISTRDLVYLLVPYVIADVEGRVRTTDIEDRLVHLREQQTNFRKFSSELEQYNTVPETERELYGKRASVIADPAKRRETKIKQYQKEKELRTKIEAIRKRRHVATTSADDSPTDFDLIASLLPEPTSSSTEEEDQDTEDILRDATLLLLRLFYTQTHGQLESIDQELELLQNAPPPVPQPPVDASREGTDWRLDQPRLDDPRAPILDSAGKPLRPFTILPSGAADRARLQQQVFQADHRLPSMTIDEYLEIERQRGNIITGGGPQSEAEPTSKEQLALDAEQDGTIFGDQKEEERRQKDENWARYTDVNPKGAGNTMNRG
ncbi:TAP42-like protein [Dentipellis sp. KUC8613]|nr:TAP42-like protein [Dentipellis sp. KUC8613]